jgi:hypothetical protein
VPDNKRSLAALQKMLASQQQAVKANVSDGQASPTAVPVEAGPSAEELVALQEQKEKEDEQQIQAQVKKMKEELTQTPQYQERLKQKQVNASEAAKKNLEERSKRIIQLRHLDPKG